jgi:hypothetical protein
MVHQRSKRRLIWRRFMRGWLRWGFTFRTAEPPDGVGAHAPKDVDFRRLSLLGFTILAFVLGTDELSVNEDMVALAQRIRDGITEAVERHDAVPFGFRLPLVVRVLPGLLRSDRQHSEAGAVAADLPLLRVLAEEADELNVIEIHKLFLHFCPISLGHARAEWILLPRRAAAFWEGPAGFTGRNRESRRREDRRAQELSRSRAHGKAARNGMTVPYQCEISNPRSHIREESGMRYGRMAGAALGSQRRLGGSYSLTRSDMCVRMGEMTRRGGGVELKRAM